jgi:TatD DNase family protein
VRGREGSPGHPGAAAGREAGTLQLIDSHCHLDDRRFADDLAAVLRRAAAAGVEAVVSVGTDPESWDRTLAVSESPAGGGDGGVSRPAIRAALGLHPQEASRAGPALWRRLEALLPRAVAVGEIGLDFYRERSPRAAQQEAFAVQLAMARRYGLPVILHVREAGDEALAALASAGIDRGVWHCFSGDWDLARRALDLGLHLGFGGLVTFEKGTDGVRDAARRCPRDRLLLETDAPYLAPHPFRGRRNEPALVSVTARRVAELRGEDAEVVAEAAAANARRLFGL